MGARLALQNEHMAASDINARFEELTEVFLQYCEEHHKSPLHQTHFKGNAKVA